MNNITLHRVKIKMPHSDIIKCQYAKDCSKAENSYRCNNFYHKCSKYRDFNLNSY